MVYRLKISFLRNGLGKKEILYPFRYKFESGLLSRFQRALICKNRFSSSRDKLGWIFYTSISSLHTEAKFSILSQFLRYRVKLWDKMESLAVLRSFLLTFITFDGELRFQPSKGHFHLKFYAPSYLTIKIRKKDGVQNFFSGIDEIGTKFFFKMESKIFQRWSPEIFFFFRFL